MRLFHWTRHHQDNVGKSEVGGGFNSASLIVITQVCQTEGRKYSESGGSEGRRWFGKLDTRWIKESRRRLLVESEREDDVSPFE